MGKDNIDHTLELMKSKLAEKFGNDGLNFVIRWMTDTDRSTVIACIEEFDALYNHNLSNLKNQEKKPFVRAIEGENPLLYFFVNSIIEKENAEGNFELTCEHRIKAALGKLAPAYARNQRALRNTELGDALNSAILFLRGTKEFLELNYRNVERSMKECDDWVNENENE